MFYFANQLGHLCIVCIGAFLLSANPSGADHEPGDLPKQPNWPKGSYELVNQSYRVHGYWVNFYDQFFYEGANRELNQMVNGLVRLEDSEVKVILHAGIGRAKSPWSKAVVSSADWAVSFLSPVPREIAELEVAEQEGAPSSTTHQVTVDIWTGGGIDLDTLELPPGLEVRSGNEIEEFIRKHKLQSAKRCPPLDNDEK